MSPTAFRRSLNTLKKMEKNHETWPAPRKPQGTWPQKYLLTDQMLELNYPTRKPQGAGARRYLPTNPTACGCEEVDAAVPRLRLTQDHIPSRSTTCPRSIAHHNRTNPEALSSAARSSHHSPGYTNPHCRRTSVSADITSRLSVSCRTSSSGIGVSTPASRSDGGTPSPPPWRMSR